MLTPVTAGLAVGNAVGGGTANGVLYANGTGNLATSAGLAFNGATLTLPLGSSATPSLILGNNATNGLVGIGANIYIVVGGGYWGTLDLSNNIFALNSSTTFAWSSGSNSSTGWDVTLNRVSVGALRVGNGNSGINYGSIITGTTDAATTTTPVGSTVTHTTSGVPAAGFGCSQLFTAQSSTTVGQHVGSVVASWVVSTDASRTGRVALFASDYSGIDREGLRVESDGTQAKIGLYGVAATARPTLTYSRGGAGETAAVAAIRVALASLGIVLDSTIA